MIYVDDLIYPDKKGKLWCHMWSDGDEAELDKFATELGLKKDWSHTSNGLTGRFYHYDLVKSMRVKAIKKGAVYMSLRDWVKDKLANKISKD